ncbi:MAG TPA: ISL3 family transposase [Gemmataceae bacterium]|nr:ISL3 family transposase [Gemmataceae bacterium]
MLSLLLPDPVLRLDRIEIAAQAVTLSLHSAATASPCPLCAHPSRHAHSRYTRHAHDLPIQGRPALRSITAHRFFCRNTDWPRRVFCDRLPRLLDQHARCTTRLNHTHRDLGLALGGEPGARRAARLGIPTSPDTLLRRVKRVNPATASDPPPRVVGVDDWAMRKGQTYGTIIIDLQRSQVLELLPGRDGVELKAWLGKHPEVEVLSRDRWASFAEAASEAAPQATQVADRWHLLKNAREALERFLDRHAGRIAEVVAAPAQAQAAQTPDPPAAQVVAPPPAAAPPAEAAPQPPAGAAVSPTPPRPPTAKQQRRLERYQEVRRRHAAGQSLRSIAREMRLAWGVVRRYARSDRCPDWRPGRAGPSQADGYRARVDAWLEAGNRNVAELHRQLEAEGSGLRYDVLRRFVSRRLAARGARRERANAAQPPRPPAPSAKGLSFAVIVRAEKRTDKQQAEVARLRGLSPEVEPAVGLVEAFATLVRKQGGGTLNDWQDKALSGASPELRRFAEGLGRDQAAVQAALDEPWSNGPVEGHINRLKTIKRQMYGRASLTLLRARVLSDA